MQEKLRQLIAETLTHGMPEVAKDMPAEKISIEYPTELAHGDYSSNVAMVLAKKLDKNPRDLASQISTHLLAHLAERKDHSFEKVEVAGPGFINFTLSQKYLISNIETINKQKKNVGFVEKLKGQKVAVEYTQPNPFKAFHIGHMMNNAIGESLSRLAEWNGAEVKRVNYQGDVGLHVAKAVFGMMKMSQEMPAKKSDKKAVADFLGRSYALGAKSYEENDTDKKTIQDINKKIYDRSDAEINKLYDQGKKWSLDYFESVYKKLGTKFDYYFFESETGEVGKKIVESHIGDGIFEVSDGATIFRGDKHGLHTRVFINKDGLPTYEAKELGLMKIKYDKFHFDRAVVVTANEIKEYFKVLLKAAEQIFPDLAKKIVHVSHGALRLPTGKMSSRTGDVITAESLIDDVIEKVKEKTANSSESPEHNSNEKDRQQIAIAAIKYSMLRQSPGKDIIFDFEKSLSLEGDSGPYLQYSAVRAHSVLEKAKNVGIKPSTKVALKSDIQSGQELKHLERQLVRFPEVVARAGEVEQPSDVVTYLTQLASAFNTFYAHEPIVVEGDSHSEYKVAVTSAFFSTMRVGLWLLAIEVPEKM